MGFHLVFRSESLVQHGLVSRVDPGARGDIYIYI